MMTNVASLSKDIKTKEKLKHSSADDRKIRPILLSLPDSLLRDSTNKCLRSGKLRSCAKLECRKHQSINFTFSEHARQFHGNKLDSTGFAGATSFSRQDPAAVSAVFLLFSIDYGTLLDGSRIEDNDP